MLRFIGSRQTTNFDLANLIHRHSMLRLDIFLRLCNSLQQLSNHLKICTIQNCKLLECQYNNNYFFSFSRKYLELVEMRFVGIQIKLKVVCINLGIFSELFERSELLRIKESF